MSLPPTYWLDQCRAELAAARARCCSHGVARERCREDHPTEMTTTGGASIAFAEHDRDSEDQP